MRRESIGNGIRFVVHRTESRSSGHGCVLVPFGAVFAGTALVIGTTAIMLGGGQLNLFAILCPGFILSIFVLVGGGMIFAGLLDLSGTAVVEVAQRQLRAGKRFGPLSYSRKRPLSDGGAFKVVPGSTKREALAGSMRVVYQPPLGERFPVANGLSSSTARELAKGLADETDSRYVDTADAAAIDAGLAAMDEQDERLEKRDRHVELEPSTSPAVWRGMLFVGLVIDTIVMALFVGALLQNGGPPLPLLIVGGIFFVIGTALLGSAVHRMMAEKKLGPPIVRVSVFPLLLGESFQVEFRQPVKGTGRHEGVTMTLAMTEKATYRRGTNTYTVTHESFAQQTQAVSPGTFSPGQDLVGVATFEIPTESMHSFEESNNKITWSMKIHTKIVRWPDYVASYQIQVLPRALVSPQPHTAGDSRDGS